MPFRPLKPGVRRPPPHKSELDELKHAVCDYSESHAHDKDSLTHCKFEFDLEDMIPSLSTQDVGELLNTLLKIFMEAAPRVTNAWCETEWNGTKVQTGRYKSVTEYRKYAREEEH